MSGEDLDWIDLRIQLALKAKPISESASSLVKAAMRSKMADRQLAAGDLARLAKDLLATLKDGTK